MTTFDLLFLKHGCYLLHLLPEPQVSTFSYAPQNCSKPLRLSCRKLLKM
ncbi:hypothetical protein MtrunA17_Chr7g0225801 [Medicago truncatula]|uniref:Uncharacterized protein n=1 Tax=Medicago truncatula TaxID=3880 RepID=A0A396H2A8_MEDTR|nr:hypothetical protein MtrunA17_Chr7g0225801 [Medicago truncatula]